MKIKDVIERTELTDKAIRLYVDNGLVAPSIDESYSGRKSIDFSEEDVERLKNVALLRKAGFSIADIKEIIESEEKAKAVVERFIFETENNICHESSIISKLKNINTDYPVTMDLICKSLSATVKENEVPKEDTSLTLTERARKNFSIVFALMGIIGSVLSVIFILVSFKFEYIHLTVEKDMVPISFFVYGGIILIFVLSLVMLAINYNHVSIGKRTKRDIITEIIALAMVMISVPTFFSSFFGTFFLSCCFCSQTTDLNDYLVLDRYVEDIMGDEIKEIFPKEIPDSARRHEERLYEDMFPFTSKYYYSYSNSIDARFDMVAEWMLSDNEFEEAKSEFISKEYHTVKKGDWECIIINDDNYGFEDENPDLWRNEDWATDSYQILMFAYNKHEKRVRYIASHAIDSYSYGPYYLSLDW